MLGLPVFESAGMKVAKVYQASAHRKVQCFVGVG